MEEIIQTIADVKTGILNSVKKSEELIKEIREELKKLQDILDRPDIDKLRQEGAGLAPEKQCSCGEPHISKRIIHRYDGKPCYVAEKEGEPDIDGYEQDQEEYSKEFVDDIKSQNQHND